MNRFILLSYVILSEEIIIDSFQLLVIQLTQSLVYGVKYLVTREAVLPVVVEIHR